MANYSTMNIKLNYRNFDFFTSAHHFIHSAFEMVDETKIFLGFGRGYLLCVF